MDLVGPRNTLPTKIKINPLVNNDELLAVTTLKWIALLQIKKAVLAFQ